MDKTTTEAVEILSKPDCLTIVKNSLNSKNDDDFQLLSYKVVKASADLVGFMGEYYKLQVEIKEKNCDVIKILQYFVKSIPLTNPVYRDECERKGFFRKESGIYSQILPHIQSYADSALFPKSYLTRSDILVLEDLSLPEKSLKQMLDTEQYSRNHYQMFLRHLSKLHAASLAWEASAGMNIGCTFKDILFELQLTTKNEWYTTGIKGVLYLAKNHPKYQYSEAQNFINEKLYQIFLDMEEFANPSKTLRNVLCHRDSWNANIFWEYDLETEEPIACRMVDFQLMRYSPPAIDALNFLYNNFDDPTQRDTDVPELLKYYYNSLREELKRLQLSEDLITAQEFEEDCRRALLPVFTLKAICVPLLKLPKGWAAQMRATEPQTFDIYLNSDRTEMFERVSEIDTTYREKILRPVQEIMEYFEFKAQ